MIEDLGGEAAHLGDVVVASVAGNADHADQVAVLRPHLPQHLAQGNQPGRVMDVVQDDAEAVRVVYVQPTGVLREIRPEACQRPPDGGQADP
jgi:hypothetical protein